MKVSAVQAQLPEKLLSWEVFKFEVDGLLIIAYEKIPKMSIKSVALTIVLISDCMIFLH